MLNPEQGTGPFNDIHGYCRGETGAGQRWWQTVNSITFHYALIDQEKGYPNSIFLDRDGFIRCYIVGDAVSGNPTPFETLIEQLTGAI